MADQRLRQRGWSIQSSSDDPSTHRDAGRARAESTATIATEPSLSHDEKVALMNSAFEDVNNDDDDVEIVIPQGKIDSDTSNDSKEGDYLEMFGDDDDDEGVEDENARKRRKLDPDESAAAAAAGAGGGAGKQTRKRVELTQFQQEKLDLAKSKLSKWAARLFDPNRPRGLVEPPQTIPLNDEFLTAFGKREKEYDELMGRTVDIDQTPLDVVDVYDSDEEDAVAGKTKDKVNYGAVTTGKVRISNLSYGTSTEVLSQVCELVGPVINVNIILDEYKQSTGRAYVVFEDHDTAQTFVDKMNGQSLDGRNINVFLAAASASSRKSGGGTKKESRYWEKDISKKCNHCGMVGHIMNSCPNADDDFKPCQLCAEVGHQMYSCPMKAVCFNCGVPGHVSRECMQRRSGSRRQICTICFSRDHHRTRCRERPWNIPMQEAVCMECGKIGHTQCSEMKWFFGLSGVTCFNCGRNDHNGFQCRRPNLEQCSRDLMLAQKEVEMADAINLSDQLSDQRDKSNRSRDRERDDRDRSNRAKSAPPSSRRDDGYSRREY